MTQALFSQRHLHCASSTARAINPKSRPKQNGKVLTLLTFLLALASVLGVLYLWVLNGMPMKMVDKQMLMAAADQSVSKVVSPDNVKLIEQQIAQVKVDSAQAQQALEKIEQAQGEQSQQLKAISGADSNVWKLAEVDYLLRMANHRLLMLKEVSGSMALLKSAEDVVKSINDPSLFLVREALAKDLESLKAVTSVDTQGVFAKLSAIALQVDKLPLFKAPSMREREEKIGTVTVITEAPRESVADQVNQTTEESAENFAQKIQQASLESATNLWKRLGINYHENFTAVPMLTAEQHSVFVQNVRLLLEQAKVGLLSGQSEVYKNSLAEAYALLELHGQKVTDIDSILDSITELQAVEVVSDLPDISTSLKALIKYQGQKLSRIISSTARFAFS